MTLGTSWFRSVSEKDLPILKFYNRYYPRIQIKEPLTAFDPESCFQYFIHQESPLHLEAESLTVMLLQNI